MKKILSYDERIIFTLLFLFISIIGFSPLFFKGATVIHRIDAAGQYYPAFLYIGQWLRNAVICITHGNFRLPFFDLSIGLGEDVISSLNYYGFGDPLNLFAVFATTANGAYIFTGLFFLRLYLSGLAFLYYAKYLNISKNSSVLGALSYSLVGYGICAGTKYIQFLAPLVYFPLMILGLEKILRNEKPHIFIFSIWYAGLCSFYFLYVSSLGLLCYGLMRLHYLHVRRPFTAIIKSILCYSAGCLLAGPVFIPAAAGFLNSSRNESSALSIILNLQNWRPYPGRIMMFFTSILPDTGTLYWTGIPVFLVLLPFICTYLLKKYRSEKWKQCTFAAWGFFIAWCTPIFSYVASAFGQYYSRWVFMMLFAYSLSFSFVYDWLSKKYKDKYSGIIAGIYLLNIVCSIFFLFLPSGKNYSEYMIPFRDISIYTDSPVNYSETIRNDKSLYRVETDVLTGINGRPENVAMLNEYNGTTYWFSVVNSSIQKMIDETGQNILSYRSYGFNDSFIYDTLAGVKYYVFRDSRTAPEHSTLCEQIQFNRENWNVYRNDLYCSFVSASDETYNETGNTLNNAERMILSSSHLFINQDNSDRNPSISPEYTRIDTNECIYTESADIIIQCMSDSDNCRIVWLDGEKLFQAGYDTVQVNGAFYDLQKKEILYLVKDSAEIIVKSSSAADVPADMISEWIGVYEFNSGNISENIRRLQNEVSTYSAEMTNNSLKMSISSDKELFLMIPVPYSRNWRITVNQIEKDPILCNTGYMAVRIPEGTSIIELSYSSRYIIYGFGSLIIGIALLFILSNEHRSFVRE